MIYAFMRVKVYLTVFQVFRSRVNNLTETPK
jgi:hypothetical protein